VTGANLEEANVDGTIFKGVRGLDAAKGFDRAEHRDNAKF